MIEKNLDTVFKCRFVATEFSTGAKHAGRIDTLALSEDDNPVIIEYKTVESSDLLNQSLFYLAWIQDHRGDFTVPLTREQVLVPLRLRAPAALRRLVPGLRAGRSRVTRAGVSPSEPSTEPTGVFWQTKRAEAKTGPV